MKFGDSLSEGLVPEWKDQYVDYKQGKKLIKKIALLKEAVDVQEVDLDLSANDTTPLLRPVDDLARVNDNFSIDSAKPGGTKGPESSRKQSIFNYSNRLSKDKKEEYANTKQKFSTWLDDQLKKVDVFYEEKEHEVYERFLILQDQLYQLKDHRAATINKRLLHRNGDQTQDHDTLHVVNDLAYHTRHLFADFSRFDLPSLPSTTFLHKWRKKKAVEPGTRLRNYKTMDDDFDPNYHENQIRNGAITDESASIDSEDYSNASQTMMEPVQTEAMQRKSKRRDYISKKTFGVPYLYARRQLKGALVEHYRSLTLIQSYRTLNKTAFRKITKKYDKALKASTMDPFMKKVSQESYFLTSDVLDKLVNYVEDLYLGYFDPENGDRKHGLDKLRSSAYAYNNMSIRRPSYYGQFFIAGLGLGFALPLMILGLYNAIYKTQTGQMPEGRYLMQIWGGFFILNLNLLLFAVNLCVFDSFKINYKFIFEFNMSNDLDYKQFWVLPSLALGCFGVLFWFSFQDYWPNSFPGRDWPWLYLGIILIIFLWPGKQFYGPSRKWLQIALWRLLLSGLYPVEFRDFFLGDILCSMTYTMGNISFFFCMYAKEWNDFSGHASASPVCGSSKSRLMGFFSCLPSIFRLLQCIRRYCDTGDWFPHLANMMKYSITTLYYCLLSVWRIDRSQSHRVAFIVFASLNSIYTSAWDIIMDWSLGQPGSKHMFLRDHLFYKKPIYYYGAMVADVILRFQWVFYACFSNQIQQLAVTSFCIAIAEAIRRFIWVFFRMENEHFTNVVLFRASRDSPLPYAISPKVEQAIKNLVRLKYTHADTEIFDHHETNASNIDEEADLGLTKIHNGAATTLIRPMALLPQLSRRTSTLVNITKVLNKAHIKDFQRRKKPIAVDDNDTDEDDDADYSDHEHAS